MADTLDLSSLDLTASSFRAWLGAYTSDVVGYPSNAGACPVAHWLDDTYGSGFYVDPFSVSYLSSCASDDWDEQCRAAPDWMWRFVSELDVQFLCDSNIPVLGCDALAILDRVLEVL